MIRFDFYIYPAPGNVLYGLSLKDNKDYWWKLHIRLFALLFGISYLFQEIRKVLHIEYCSDHKIEM